MKSIGNKTSWTTTTSKNLDLGIVSTRLNVLLWLSIATLGLTTTFVNIYFPIFEQSPPLMSALIIMGIVSMLTVARFTSQGKKSWRFLCDARLEVRKVLWPTRQETVNLTLVVLLITVVASLFVYFMGLLFMYMIRWILI
jgi:preprotein translocase subunit SecE